MNREGRLEYIADLATLSTRVASRFVSEIHGEDMDPLDHIGLVASGKIEVPPERVLQVAAASCVVSEVYDYIGVMTGARLGDADEDRDALFEALELFEDVADDAFRAEPGVGDHLALVDLAQRFRAAHDALAACERKASPEGERLFGDMSAAYLAMVSFVTERIAAADAARRAAAVASA